MQCRPVVSLVRAGPSRPERCWSATQRSYLMIIAPPLEALYFPPLREVMQTYADLYMSGNWDALFCRLSWLIVSSAGSQQCGLCLMVYKPSRVQNKNKALRRCRFREPDWPSSSAVIEKHDRYIITMRLITVWHLALYCYPSTWQLFCVDNLHVDYGTHRMPLSN